MATNFTSVLSPVSQNFSHKKSLHLYKLPFSPEEDVRCVTDMGLKHRGSTAALTSVFLFSRSEDSDSSMEVPNSPVEISPARKRTLSFGSVFYDDPSSSNISVLSVETSISDTSLLDSDPFADLTASPVETMATLPPLTPHVTAGPKSPLSAPSSPSREVPWFRTTPTTSPALPAYKKPAFRNSPSLPSLSTLANLHIKIPRKVRKGNVGAGLPSEPWNLAKDDEPKDPPSFTTFSDSENSIAETSSEEEEEYDEPRASTWNFVAERLGDRLSDEFELPGSERIISPRCSPPSSPSTSGDVPKEHSRASSSSSYEFEANDWFPQSWQAPADLMDLPPLSSLYSNQITSESTSLSSDHSHTSLLETSSIDPLIITNEKTSSHNSMEAVDGHATEEDLSVLNCSPRQGAKDCGMPANPHSPAYSSYERDDEAINVNQFRDCDPSSCEAAQSFEPGSSSTIRPSPLDKRSYSAGSSIGNSRRRKSVVTSEMWIQGGAIGVSAESVVDGGEYQRGRSTDGAGWSSGYGSGAGGGGAGSQRGRGYSSGGYSGSGYGAGSGGGGDDDDDGKRNNRFFPGSSFSASPDDSEEEDEDDESDDYGQPSGLPPAAESDDDDVPLAQRIPTALKAQQSIRLKDREDRDKRRKEREIRAAARQQQAVVRPSSTQHASLPASRSTRRPSTAPIQSVPPPFAVDDLTKRLDNIQPMSRSNLRSADGPKSVSSSQDLAPAPTLRPMRSFHRPEPRMTREDWNAPPLPLPAAADSKVTRTNTRARARSTTSREESVNASQPRASHQTAPVDTTQKLERKRTTKPVEGTKSARTSSDKRPTALPAPAELARQINAKIVSQQRIFIGDRQRFVVVEVNPATTAGDVIRMVEAQGALKEWRGSGGWMLFEIAQDFGMERPIRSFELLSDVEASWNKAKTVNVFLMKLTTLAPILSRSALPTSSPTHYGYVEWESKRGKWNKRYLMLKSHCLWLSKRDNGRDEELVCSLSNFDAYQITRLVKAPKDFTFAVKSTDNLSFFENTADYLHIFSCKTDAGEKWMEKILLARSYVLHQERNVLFQSSTKTHPKSPPPQAESNLSRSLTKRGATQPLVNVNPGNLFEPGTLLHR